MDVDGYIRGQLNRHLAELDRADDENRAIEEAKSELRAEWAADPAAAAECAIAYCRPRSYPAWIEREFVTVAMFRLRHGASMATAIASAKVRADFCFHHGRHPSPPSAA